jgi:hypothetical protein
MDVAAMEAALRAAATFWADCLRALEQSDAGRTRTGLPQRDRMTQSTETEREKERTRDTHMLALAVSLF